MFKIHLSHAIVSRVKRPYLSLILPVFNEEKRILGSLERIYAFLVQLKCPFELIVVDDGSSDQTAIILEKFAKKKTNIEILRLLVNLGKGAAIREGVKISRGKYLFFSDIDLSVSISYLPTFLASLVNGVDVAIASRRVQGSKVKVRQHSLRQSLGHGFTRLSSTMLGLGISDVTCGFKGFTSRSAQGLFSNSRINRWAFDAEILYLARKNNLTVAEIPVEWSNKEGTKVNIFRDLPRSFLDLITIRFRK